MKRTRMHHRSRRVTWLHQVDTENKRSQGCLSFWSELRQGWNPTGETPLHLFQRRSLDFCLHPAGGNNPQPPSSDQLLRSGLAGPYLTRGAPVGSRARGLWHHSGCLPGAGPALHQVRQANGRHLCTSGWGPLTELCCWSPSGFCRGLWVWPYTRAYF